ncbi:MAG: beta-ketoacyl-[Bacteroidaceae bacterium]|nr:beta-ketoacyl-[acyl-carrier-protein] synthase family protein [Bacteroidaceae bacterium]
MANVIVAGYGIICAIGNDASAVLKSLKAGQTGIAPMRYLQSSHKELPVGEVKLSNEEMKQMLGLDKEAIISRTALMGAIAIRQALEHAQLTLKGKRVVVISGTTVGGMDMTERYFKGPSAELEEALRKHDCGSSTRQMANLAGLEDAEVCTVSTACSSAVNAIILGSEMLKRGEADIVIAGGTEALSMFHLNGFNSLMILDKAQCRPFDKTRTGLNLGEGAAFLVLTHTLVKSKELRVKSKSNNLERKSSSNPSLFTLHSSVYIRGYANRCDAFHQTASSENGEGAFLAMTDALKMAGLRPEDISYINAHGTGTPNNDASESEAIRRVFADNIPPVSSTKGFTGHTTSASGAIETVICILALQNNFLPANLGWKEQDEACITPLRNEELRMKNEEFATARNILCNSFGFGGNDSAVVIGKSSLPDFSSKEQPLLKRRGQEAFSPSLNLKSFPSGEDLGEATTCVLGEAVIDDVEQLGELREFVTAGEARRMGKLMKAATITSMRALRQAGVERPDAIITATAYGMLETSERFLTDMVENGEEMLSPTLFMQSTHNTIGSALAIRLKCHGYNITYSQGADSFRWALCDAKRLIETGKAKTVLVGQHDEATPTMQHFCRQMGCPVPPMLYSRSIVLSRKT